MAQFDESRIEWEPIPAPAAAKFDESKIDWQPIKAPDDESYGDQVSRYATHPAPQPAASPAAAPGSRLEQFNQAIDIANPPPPDLQAAGGFAAASKLRRDQLAGVDITNREATAIGAGASPETAKSIAIGDRAAGIKPRAPSVAQADPELKPLRDQLAAQVAAGATVDLPRMFGQAEKWFSEPGRTLYEMGAQTEREANQRESDNPDFAQPQQGQGFWTDSALNAARMAAPSFAAMGAGMAAAPLGAIAATAATAGASFGLYGGSQAQQTKEAVLQAGGSESDANFAGWVNLFIEGGGETVGNISGARFLGIGGKVFKGIGEKAVREAVHGATDAKVLRPFLSEFAKTAASESGTEFFQNYTEAKVEERYGVQGHNAMQEGVQGAGAALVMSAVLGPFGLNHIVQRAQANGRIAAALSDPAAPAAYRAAAAKIVYDNVKEVNPEAASVWASNASAAIAARAPISLDVSGQVASDKAATAAADAARTSALNKAATMFAGAKPGIPTLGPDQVAQPGQATPGTGPEIPTLETPPQLPAPGRTVGEMTAAGVPLPTIPANADQMRGPVEPPAQTPGEAHAAQVEAARAEVEQRRAALTQAAQEPARPAQPGETTAAKITIDPADPAASFAAIAAAPITQAGAQAPAPAHVNPQEHANSAGDLAAVFLHADQLNKQAKLTPPKERQAVVAEAQRVAGEAKAHIDAYRAKYGPEAASHLHTTAAQIYHSLKGDYRTLVKPTPVQETAPSTEREQPTGVNNALEQRAASEVGTQPGGQEGARGEEGGGVRQGNAEGVPVGNEGVQAEGNRGGGAGAVTAPEAGTVVPKISTPVDEAAHEAAASPTNELPPPTPAQAEAGNYKMGHPVFSNGLSASVETPSGGVREDTKNVPPKWRQVMKGVHYGYWKQTEGADGIRSRLAKLPAEQQKAKGRREGVDVMIKDGTPSDYNGPVFVIDQVGRSGKFDEHKTMVGFATEAEARAAYQAQYPEGWKGLGNISQTTMQGLKTWMRFGDMSKPYAEVALAKTPAEVKQHYNAQTSEFASGLPVTAIKRGSMSVDPRGVALDALLNSPPSTTLATPGVKAIGGRALTDVEKGRVAAIIRDAIKLGVPRHRFMGVEGFMTHSPSRSEIGTNITTRLPDGRVITAISFRRDLLAMDHEVVAKILVVNALHEGGAGHEIDRQPDNEYERISETAPDFHLRIVGDKVVPIGAVVTEAVQNFENDGHLKSLLSYPLDPKYVSAAVKRFGTDKAEKIIKSELFAQLGPVWYTDPELLKREAPTAYKLFQEIHNATQQRPGSIAEGLRRDREVVRDTLRARGAAARTNAGEHRPSQGGPEVGVAGQRIGKLGQLRGVRVRERGEARDTGNASAQRALTKAPNARARNHALDIRENNRKPIGEKASLEQVGRYLDKQVHDEYGGPLDIHDPKAMARATAHAIAEVGFQVKQARTGLDWYEEDIKTAHDLTSRYIPELVNGSKAGSPLGAVGPATHRQMFSLVAGLHSPHQPAAKNWENAGLAYKTFVETGRLPEVNPETNDRWGPYVQPLGFAQMNSMVEDMGVERVVNWLLSQHTVAELNAMKSKYGIYKNAPVSGKRTDVKLGAYIFGEKVGPFSLGLNGINTEIAVDVWAARTLHRYMGTLMQNGEMTEGPRSEEERAAFKQIAIDVAGATGYNPNQIQAVLWFFEQQLYTQLGLKTASPKFSDGARDLLERVGINDTGTETGTGAERSGAAQVAAQPGQAAATVNIGLDTADGLGIFPAEAINALRAQGVEVTSREVRKSGTEDTLIATLDRPLTPDEAHAVAVELRQQAIAQKVGDEGALYGPEKHLWNGGKFDPSQFMEPETQTLQGQEMRGDGRGFTDFFTEASKGNRAPDKSVPYKPVIDIKPLKAFSDEYVKHRGNFDDHIATSIPGFREVQQAVGDAIVKAYQDSLGGATVLDIGASEGAFNKTITAMSDGRIQTLALDPNVQMAKFFEEHSQVPGADYDVAALGTKEQEGKLAWTEDDGTKIRYFKPIEKYDVVHEAMVFQFISNTRDAQFARVKELMKPRGIALFEEKVIDNTPQWKENEAQKDAYKAQYYTKAQMDAKKAEVLAKGAAAVKAEESKAEQKVVGMNDLMVSTPELEAALKKHWHHVAQYWDSGNFKGYVASDDYRALHKFLDSLVPLDSEYATTATPRYLTPRLESQEISDMHVPTTPAFRKWFRNSKVVDENGDPLVVYHGSLSELTRFEQGKVSENSFAGPGFYFTSSHEDASHNYADLEGPDQSIKLDMLREDLGSDEDYVQDMMFKYNIDNVEDLARHMLGFENEGVVYPVYLRIENPYYLDRAPVPPGKAKMFASQDVSATRNEFDVGVPQDYDTAEEFRKAVEGAGYDGVIDEGPARFNMFGVDESTKHYVAFKPTQVKSAIGNRGTFSIRNQDIAAQEHDFGDLTPEQEAALRRTGGIVKNLTLGEKYAQMRANIRTKLAQGVADQFRPLKDLDIHAYNLARLSKASDGALEAMLTYGNLSLVDGVTDARAGGQGVITTFQRVLQGEHHRFMWWLAANRAEQLAAEDREHLFGPEDIRALKGLNRGRMPDGTSRQAAYEQALREYNRFSKNILDIAEQSGIIDGDSRATWEREFYVPFYRAMEAGATTANVGKRASGLVRQYAFKKLKGGEDKLNQDLMANVLMNWSHLLSASAKNRAAIASLEAAANAGIAVRLTSPEQGATKHTVWALENGRKVYYEVHDPYTLAAITSLEAGIVGGWAGRALSKFKNLLTLGVTANPAFKVRNLIRDTIASIAQSELSYNAAGNVATGVKHMVQKGQVHASLLAGGGLIRFGSMIEGNRASHVDKLIKKGVPRNRIVDTPEKMKDMIQAAWDHYNELGDISEGANRAALYAQQRAQGKTHEEASMAARDLLDFSMQGSWPAVRFIVQTVPFTNARIQGLYKLGRAGAENPVRMASVIGATALASIALMLAYKDDDDWKKREDWDRDNYWWFKIGDTAWRIPKPFEVGAIATLAERAVELWVDDEMTKRRFMQRVGFAVSQTFSMNPVPQVAKPLLDVYSNVDSFTGRPIETAGMENRSKPERYDSSTSLPARILGQAGDVTNLSPAQIDHLVRGYFGWLGTAAFVAADAAVRPFSGQPDLPERQLKDWFLAGNFVETLPADQSRYVTQFYDQAKVIQQAYADYRHMQQTGDYTRARAFREEHRAEIAKEPIVTMAQRELQVLNQQKARIEADDSMSPSMKRTKLSLLASKRNAIAARIAKDTSLD